ICRVDAAISKLPQKPDVSCIDIVLLISDRLSTNAQQVPAALPGEMIVVVESIVGKDLGVRVGANVAAVVVDALPGKAHVLLRAKRNPNLLVAGVAEDSRRIAGNTVIPAYTRKAEAAFVNDGRREIVDPASTNDLGRIGIVCREEHPGQGSGEVAPGALSVKPVDFIRVIRCPVDLEILLIVRDERGLRALVVILYKSVRRCRIECRIEVGMCREVFCNRIRNRHAVVRVRGKVVLSVIQLNALDAQELTKITLKHRRGEKAR